MDDKNKRKYAPILRKVIELGEVDLWLRRMADSVPHRAAASTIATGEPVHKPLPAAISARDIRDTQGFRQLTTACRQNDVCLDARLTPDHRLEIGFPAGRRFKDSRTFGEEPHARAAPVTSSYPFALH